MRDKEKKRGLKFEENPICFSQMINNDESEHSGKSIFRQSQKKSMTKNINLTHQSNILSFSK